MTIFVEPREETTSSPPYALTKRPSRWSLPNWPVRWKVLAIVAIPTLVAVLFAGSQIYASATKAADLRLAALRAEIVRPIESYLTALEVALAATGDGEQGARAAFETSRERLQLHMAHTDMAPEVQSQIITILNGGRQLLDGVESGGINLRDRVLGYEPILRTAREAIIGSVRVDDEQIRAAAEELGRAVAARGHVFMEKLLVDQGSSMTPQELRATMLTLAGTDPSTLIGLHQVPGLGPDDADVLRQQVLTRMAIISDPAAVLAGSPQLLSSLEATDEIVRSVIEKTTGPVIEAMDEQASAALVVPIRYAAIALASIIAGLMLVYVVARSLIGPLRRLRAGALRVAHKDLPAELEKIQVGEGPPRIETIPVHTTEEVGQVAHAVDELHGRTLAIAAEQARLQLQIGDMFETLSRRSRSLVDQQLALIDELERDEEDAERLDALFKLDHLAAQMRRNATNLLVLAGSQVRRESAAPVPVAEVIGAATSHVEDYRRVVTSQIPDSSLVGTAAGDVAHLLAELIDNALRYSPPTTPVQVSAVHTGNCELVIEVADSGLGMTESDIRIANTRLDSGGEVTPYTTRHMGLFVVGRLASRHGLSVWLRPTVTGEQSGTTAAVWIPATLVAGAGESGRQWPDYTVPQAQYTTVNGRNGTSPVEPPILSVPRRVVSVREDKLEESAANTTGTNGAHAAFELSAPSESTTGPIDTAASAHEASEAAAQPTNGHAKPPSDYTDTIFKGLLTELPIDPEALKAPVEPTGSIWDSGWAAARHAATAPVEEWTETGLPVRRPGDRLVPGTVGFGRHRAAHRRTDENDSAASPHAEDPIVHRDPDAVRASLTNHRSGVRAGRSHARHARQEMASENG